MARTGERRTPVPAFGITIDGAAMDSHLQRALDLLDHVPMIDGHNDLPWVIRIDSAAQGDVRAYGLDRVHQDSDTDIPRLREGRVAGQVWAAYIPSDIPHPARSALEQIDVILQINAAHPETFLPALKSADVMRAKKAGKIASIMAVEGGVGLENSLGPLRVWHAAGVRLMTLCHNGTLDWIDSATDEARHGGLTAFGRDVVRELNRLGIIVDCAHVAPAAMHAVLDTTSAPIVFSHSNARALCDHVRNVPDDVLARVPANDGMVMATFVQDFIDENVRRWMEPLRIELRLDPSKGRAEAIQRLERTQGPMPRATLAQLADHIEYIARIVGRSRVGIGSDFFGDPHTPLGLTDVTCFPHLLAEMFRRGWPERDVAGLAGRNFLRVFRAVEREGARLRKTDGAKVATLAD